MFSSLTTPALLLAAVIVTTSCATQQPKQSLNFVSQFSEMSTKGFILKVDASANVVREYAICKAVWFAGKQNKTSLSLSNPAYVELTGNVPGVGVIPADWVQLTTVAYFGSNSPEGNPSFQVADKTPGCRAAFDWFHRPTL
jgi:hypothetical protein